ncbi:PREDICTED: uncharacterized protein LOC107071244 [Polistes dominula]|uniref:Uncharacterized protein LOC107071244 n=1 Tax=Polistes dominula TaxID=743375 RepID=A0ABM1IZC2_POLDO|nr:PREDICTED: uncharacterized protein LOC107071244 [Polistes dominula]
MSTECFIIFRDYVNEDISQCIELFINEGLNLVNKILFDMFGVKNAGSILFWTSMFMLCFIIRIDVSYYMIIPTVFFLIKMITFTIIWKRIKKIREEICKIIKSYVFDDSKCIWVFEVLTPHSKLNVLKDDFVWTFIVEEELHSRNIDLLKYDRQIIAIISIDKHETIPDSIIIKRLIIHEEYRMKYLGTYCLDMALAFAKNHGYVLIFIMLSKYMDDAINMVSNRGFKLYKKHELSFVKSLMAIPTYEYVYNLRSKYYYPKFKKQRHITRTYNLNF